jgi:hypothetical protein
MAEQRIKVRERLQGACSSQALDASCASGAAAPLPDTTRLVDGYHKHWCHFDNECEEAHARISFVAGLAIFFGMRKLVM